MFSLTKKHTVLSLALVLFVSPLFLSCELEEEPEPSKDPTPHFTDDEIAAIIITSIQEENGGALQEMKLAIESTEAFNNSIYCGIDQPSTTSFLVKEEAPIRHDYDYATSALLNCNSADVPSFLAYSLNGTSNYTSKTMLGNTTVESSFEVFGLEASNPNYVVDVDVFRNGYYKARFGYGNSFLGSVEINSDNVQLNKNTLKIETGKLFVSASARSTRGAAFDMEGVVIFNGDNTATLSLASGELYPFNL